MLADGCPLVLSTNCNIWYPKVPHNVLACTAVSELTCCAFVSVLMRCPSITRSIWCIVATSCPLAWRECGGGRRRENPARSQLVFGQCTQRRSRSRKASAGLVTGLRLAKLDSSRAGTCMSCKPGSWSMYHRSTFVGCGSACAACNLILELGLQAWGLKTTNTCLLLKIRLWFFRCLN